MHRTRALSVLSNRPAVAATIPVAPISEIYHNSQHRDNHAHLHHHFHVHDTYYSFDRLWEKKSQTSDRSVQTYDCLPTPGHALARRRSKTHPLLETFQDTCAHVNDHSFCIFDHKMRVAAKSEPSTIRKRQPCSTTPSRTDVFEVTSPDMLHSHIIFTTRAQSTFVPDTESTELMLFDCPAHARR